MILKDSSGGLADAVLPKLTVQGLPVQPQHARRHGLVAVHRMENMQDIATLHLFQGSQFTRVFAVEDLPEKVANYTGSQVIVELWGDL